MNNTNGTNANINTPPIPQPSSGGGEFDGSDFRNNLFSDLAPLLTLFGEQVTKQFLSQAMGLGDDILLAMAPLGILTCVVSAIRVGGKKWLKALVGRARESRVTAEMEILSSTSDNVCELWSGTEIVRERGQPKMKEFVYRRVNRETEPGDMRDPIVYDLETALEKEVLEVIRHRPVTGRVFFEAGGIKKFMQEAPNLTLNVTNAIQSPLATWAFAILGVAIQLTVFMVASLVTYHWKLAANGYFIVRYGYPLFLRLDSPVSRHLSMFL